VVAIARSLEARPRTAIFRTILPSETTSTTTPLAHSTRSHCFENQRTFPFRFQNIVSILIEAAVELKARHTHTEIVLQFAGTFVYLEDRACEGKTIISGSDNPREPRPFRANCCATSTDTLCNHCHWINRNSIVFENLK